MKYSEEKTNLTWKLLLGSLIVCAVVLRLILMKKWLVLYCDDDQTLMWNATAAYGHFMIPEPFFWGQSYGVMFESFVAVPMYWLGVPLNAALPAATILLSIAAYLFVSFLLAKKGHFKFACAVMASYLLMSWRWDILTSVPRCYISGMSLAVLGSIWINTAETKRNVLCAAFLCMAAVIMTNSAAVIAGIGYLYFVLNANGNCKKIPALLGGSVCGFVLYLLLRNFYVINAEYNLHPSPALVFSSEVLRANIRRIPYLLSDFSFLDNGWVVLMLLALALIYVFLSKHWKTLLLLVGDIFLMLFLMAMRKTANYSDNSVTFSQTRMFLCWTYSLLPIVCFWTEEKASKTGSGSRFDVTGFFGKRYVQTLVCLSVLMIAVGANVMKLDKLDADLLNPASRLRNGYAANCFSTRDVMKTCAEINEKAELVNADTVVTGDRRALSYAFDALYFGKYTVYNCVYDRRTWNYIAMTQARDRRCLFINGIAYDPIAYETIDFDRDGGTSAVQYFKENYGYNRRP